MDGEANSIELTAQHKTEKDSVDKVEKEEEIAMKLLNVSK
jgi:hypothetical protein